MSFKSLVIEQGGQVSVEDYLNEFARRLHDSHEFGLTPKLAARILASVMVDAEQAQEIVKKREAAGNDGANSGASGESTESDSGRPVSTGEIVGAIGTDSGADAAGQPEDG